jgi:hypothetical protein
MRAPDPIQELCDRATSIQDPRELNALLSKLRSAVSNQSDRLKIMLKLQPMNSQLYAIWSSRNLSKTA